MKMKKDSKNILAARGPPSRTHRLEFMYDPGVHRSIPTDESAEPMLEASRSSAASVHAGTCCHIAVSASTHKLRGA